EAFELLLGPAPGDDQAVKLLEVAGFDDQSGLHEGNADSCVLPFFELMNDGGFDARMNNRVEPDALGWILENDGAESLAVDATVGRENFWAEFSDDIIVSGLAGFGQSVGEAICVDDVEAEIAKSLSDDAFPAGNAAGDANALHSQFGGALRRMRGGADAGG